MITRNGNSFQKCLSLCSKKTNITMTWHGKTKHESETVFPEHKVLTNGSLNEIYRLQDLFADGHTFGHIK